MALEVTPCRLCGDNQPLQNSHVLPEFAYKPIYDENHKGVVFDPLDPGRARKFQKGFSEPMLCRNCEQSLNDEYERGFKEFWFDDKPLAPLETQDSSMLQIPEAARFKLFHHSVLLRADLATRSGFSNVQLGDKHRRRIKEMIRSTDAGESHEYPIVCTAIRNPEGGGIWWDFVSSPHKGKLWGHRFYLFTFGGCAWMYFVRSHRSERIESIAIQPNGSMPVQKVEWPLFRALAARAKL